jgi:hypothetical protein
MDTRLLRVGMITVGSVTRAVVQPPYLSSSCYADRPCCLWLLTLTHSLVYVAFKLYSQGGCLVMNKEERNLLAYSGNRTAAG